MVTVLDIINGFQLLDYLINNLWNVGLSLLVLSQFVRVVALYSTDFSLSFLL